MFTILKKKHQQFKSIFDRLASIFADRIVSIVINILIARNITNSEYGFIILVYSLTDIFISIFDFGLTSTLAIEFSKNLKNSFNVFRQSLIYKLIIIPVVVMLVFLSAGHEISSDFFAVLLTIVIIECLNEIIQIYHCVIYAEAGFSFLFKITVISRTVQALAVIFIVWFDLNYLYLIGTHFFNIMIQFLFLKNQTNKIFSVVNLVEKKRNLLHVIKQYLPLGLNKLFIVFSGRADNVQISSLLSNIQLSYYGVAQTFVRNTAIIGNGIATVFLPEFAKSFNEDKIQLKQSVNKSLRVVIFSGLLLTVLISLFSSVLIKFLWGENYSESVLITVILSFVIPFQFVCNIYGFVFNIAEKSNYNLIIKMISFFVVLTGNFWLIPRFGLISASLLFVSSTAIQSVVMFFLFRKISEPWNEM